MVTKKRLLLLLAMGLACAAGYGASELLRGSPPVTRSGVAASTAPPGPAVCVSREELGALVARQLAPIRAELAESSVRRAASETPPGAAAPTEDRSTAVEPPAELPVELAQAAAEVTDLVTRCRSKGSYDEDDAHIGRRTLALLGHPRWMKLAEPLLVDINRGTVKVLASGPLLAPRLP